jgi:cytosine/adenosine deaminase-related metal-dependent hydrolase
MAMRKLIADNIFTGRGMTGPGHVLVIETDGTIIDLIPVTDAGDDLETSKGTLCPGFINTHCHLELSHLKDQVPSGTGLVEFVRQVVAKRGFEPEIIQEAIKRAEQEMFNGGIVAVGDICNTADTLEVKKESAVRWTNFIEVLSFTDAKAYERISHYKNIREKFRSIETPDPAGKSGSRSNLVPHAPYSISPLSFQLINAETEGQVISMHNQETTAEDELYEHGTGEFMKFFAMFGEKSNPFPVTGKSSIRSVLPHFNRGQHLILVHNTCMKEDDMDFADDHAERTGLTLHYCLCANANLYIEERMPPVARLMKGGRNIVIGTDSPGSNYQLSITEEIRTLRKHFPDIELATMLQWATLNGAKALRREDQLGSFEKGKRPGIVLLDEDLHPKRIC